ncbi:MAG: AbrB/MazE/SpoVT family DNA-binding domain-containing protein [Bifidobacteriaceae bacterium]|jgi:AbrB family looped-hinge helix DNA binding protein|nr:AbrB/MazE/SpoVT family DNA-binding domain-containing protein [Bifidobacteriaceae bacterium]
MRHFGAGEGWSHGLPFGPGQVLGTTIVSERGQAVIPAEARKALGIAGGDRFVVFGHRQGGALVLVKAETFTQFSEFFLAKASKLNQMTEAWLDGLEDTGPAQADSAGPAEADAPKPAPEA